MDLRGLLSLQAVHIVFRELTTRLCNAHFGVEGPPGKTRCCATAMTFYAGRCLAAAVPILAPKNCIGSFCADGFYQRTMAKTILVTGSSGLIGSEVCVYFGRELGYQVHGVDNNQRAVFFGPQGDTRWNQTPAARESAGFCASRARHPRPERRARAGAAAQTGRHRPHRGAAEPRSRRRHPV